jgi:hypothetical protein
MIADKVIPSFYLLELEGDAVQAVLSGDFGVERIAVGSFDFNSDLLATSALQQAMQTVADVVAEDLDSVKEETAFNPEFFPTLKYELAIDVEAEIEEAQAITDVMTEDMIEKGQVPILITNAFDPIGDFIQSRWIVSSDNFKMTGRIAANPTKYMMHKGFEQVKRHETIHRDELNKLVLH